jgi:hypothetical protein
MGGILVHKIGVKAIKINQPDENVKGGADGRYSEPDFKGLPKTDHPIVILVPEILDPDKNEGKGDHLGAIADDVVPDMVGIPFKPGNKDDKDADDKPDNGPESEDGSFHVANYFILQK